VKVWLCGKIKVLTTRCLSFWLRLRIQTQASATSVGLRHGHVSPEIENMANIAGAEMLHSGAHNGST